MSAQNHGLPVPAVPLSFEPYDDGVAPGAFHVHEDGHAMGYMCPCGCGSYGLLPLNGAAGYGASWDWDENRACPTLSPSIRRLSGCRWHGYLRAGVWDPHEDSGR